MSRFLQAKIEDPRFCNPDFVGKQNRDEWCRAHTPLKQKIDEKLRAIKLREHGYSLNEIVDNIGVAKGSVSVWVRNVPLDDRARKRLLTRIKLGQLIAAESKRKKTAAKIEELRIGALIDLNSVEFNKIHKRIICSLLYWCEGSKQSMSGVRFTNSDPVLIKSFMSLFRSSFNLDESKLRVCVHLHKYHDPNTQITFWSKVTGIEPNQFIKPYLKPNTGKRIRRDYPGCATIYYYDINMARRLVVIAKEFLGSNGSVV